MKVVYHPRFTDSKYADDPAAARGRIHSIIDRIEDLEEIEFVEPDPAEKEDIELVHPPDFIEDLERKDDRLYDMSVLSAGGAIEAAELAYEGEPTFAVIRPPGHHASPESRWGFCYLNNMAIANMRLMSDDKIESAFILDFDLHKGDGNLNCLQKNPDIKIFNPRSELRDEYLDEVEEMLTRIDDPDIIGISAGFDEHVTDWGGKLKTEDFEAIGRLIKRCSEKKCKNRRFALLEGGYNREVLGENVAAFLRGFRD